MCRSPFVPMLINPRVCHLATFSKSSVDYRFLSSACDQHGTGLDAIYLKNSSGSVEYRTLITAQMLSISACLAGALNSISFSFSPMCLVQLLNLSEALLCSRKIGVEGKRNLYPQRKFFWRVQYLHQVQAPHFFRNTLRTPLPQLNSFPQSAWTSKTDFTKNKSSAGSP